MRMFDKLLKLCYKNGQKLCKVNEIRKNPGTGNQDSFKW